MIESPRMTSWVPKSTKIARSPGIRPGRHWGAYSAPHTSPRTSSPLVPMGLEASARSSALGVSPSCSPRFWTRFTPLILFTKIMCGDASLQTEQYQFSALFSCKYVFTLFFFFSISFVYIFLDVFNEVLFTGLLFGGLCLGVFVRGRRMSGYRGELPHEAARRHRSRIRILRFFIFKI